MTVKSHPEFDSISHRIRQLKPLAISWQGTVFRSIRPEYWASEDLLAGEESRQHGGRWNPPSSFRRVYLALTLNTALEEMKGWLRYYHLPPESALPRVFTAVETNLSEVLNLTDGAIRQRLQISLDRMKGEDWRRMNDRGKEALTQAVGRAAFEADFEGLVVPSVQDAKGRNLVVFPEKLLPRSQLHEVGVIE